MKRFFLLICASAMLANCSNLYGQENPSKFSLSMDVASGFIWRGLPLNTSPVVQPSFTFAPGKFFVGAWASTPFTPNEYQEIDLFVGIQFTPAFSISLTDYFGYGWLAPSYFKFKKEETGHVLDLQLVYDGTGSFPLKAMISTILAGNDLKGEWDGSTREKNHSTYIEIGYGNNCKGVDWEIFIGGVPMASEFYGIDGEKFINLGVGVSKSFEITPTYSLPLSVKFTVNPAMEAVFLSAAITLF